MTGNETFLSNRDLNISETEQRLPRLASRPLKLMAVLTRICNLACVMCPRVRCDQVSLPYEQVEKLFPLLPYLETADWQGGEVFLLDYFKRLFLKTSEYPGVCQRVTTNGLLIDREWARLLAGGNTRVGYSVDAVTERTYESIRLNGKFRDLLASLDLMNGAMRTGAGASRLELNAVVMRSNYRELALFPDFCARHNFSGVTFDVLYPEVAPQEDIFSGPDEAAMRVIAAEMPGIERRFRELGIGFRCNFSGYLRRFSAAAPEGGAGAPPPRACLSPWRSLHVEPEGNVFPECNCKVPVGNLAADSLEDIWNGEKMQRYRRLVAAGRYGEICSAQCKFYEGVGRR
ncbi:MAG: radical SAM protein [Elusimicrobiales bacterium]|nr:radical SAM protein [Elusimicrobiales bacterium]